MKMVDPCGHCGPFRWLRFSCHSHTSPYRLKKKKKNDGSEQTNWSKDENKSKHIVLRCLEEARGQCSHFIHCILPTISLRDAIHFYNCVFCEWMASARSRPDPRTSTMQMSFLAFGRVRCYSDVNATPKRNRTFFVLYRARATRASCVLCKFSKRKI